MTDFKSFEFRTQPWFDEDNFQGFNAFIPMKTIVVSCFDPRANEAPNAVAEFFGDEIFPGENVYDNGIRVGHTATLFPLFCAAGRAASALPSIATMDYLFNFKRLVIVHHSFCGGTGFREEQLFDKFHEHYHSDVEDLFGHGNLAIADFEESLKHDLKLLRESPAVPKHIELYGFFFEMNQRKLVEVVRDIPA